MPCLTMPFTVFRITNVQYGGTFSYKYEQKITSVYTNTCYMIDNWGFLDVTFSSWGMLQCQKSFILQQSRYKKN